jgi:hypothetical protein
MAVLAMVVCNEGQVLVEASVGLGVSVELFKSLSQSELSSLR